MLHHSGRYPGDGAAMPRRAKGPRLYLDPQRRDWVIRDGSTFVRTGCAESRRDEAETALGRYIARKHKPRPSATPALADVLLAYLSEHAMHGKRPKNEVHTVSNLAKFWGNKRVSDVTARACREYSATRPPVAARRDLQTLRAALHYWHREYGPLASLPSVTLPRAPEPRDRWLTRNEAARLLRAARRVQHLRRFVLLGLYTGTRFGALLSLEWSWVDLERGVMRRRAPGEADSSKRRPPVRLSPRMLAHLRRWRRIDDARIRWVCHYDGTRLRTVRRSWETAIAAAGIAGRITPHTLRHTRATWLMQAGVSPWEAAGHLGMSVQVLERVYGHHHPDYQRRASEV